MMCSAVVYCDTTVCYMASSFVRASRRELGRPQTGYCGRSPAKKPPNLFFFVGSLATLSDIVPRRPRAFRVSPSAFVTEDAYRIRVNLCMSARPFSCLSFFSILTSVAERAPECDRSVPLPSRQRDASHARGNRPKVSVHTAGALCNRPPPAPAEATWLISCGVFRWTRVVSCKPRVAPKSRRPSLRPHA